MTQQADPKNWLDPFFYKDVQDPTGAQLPSQPLVQFAGAVTVADDPSNGRTVVTVTGTVVEGPRYLAAPVSSSLLVVGQHHLIDTSAGPFTQALPTAGMVEGNWYEWSDHAGQWLGPTGTKLFSLDAGSGALIVDPLYIGNGPPAGETNGLTRVVQFTAFRGTYRTTYVAAHGAQPAFWHVRRMV